MTTSWTNASPAALAATISNARRGQFASVIYQKGGAQKGRGAARQTYGDDLVHDVFVSGFSYRGLKARDLEVLLTSGQAAAAELASKGHLAWDNPRKKDAAQVALTAQDFQDAWLSMVDSCERSSTGTNEATHDHVFEPLVVNGEMVRGARVYVGPSDPAKACAADPGTVYLSGLKISRKVLEPAPNGPIPKGRSGVAATCKALLARKLQLPSLRYVSYKLNPKDAWVLKIGGEAAAAAVDSEIILDPAAVEAVRQAITA
jgi:hypothetical protein